MNIYEILTLIGLVSGPVVAVIITLWVDSRRRTREQRVTVLRMLMSTRHLPADPAFQVAINLIPIEFAKKRQVMAAYREFIDAAAVQLDGKNDRQILDRTKTKIVRLLYAVGRALGFPIRETDLQTSGYASDGWVQREQLLSDSQKAMREIAEVLKIQTRIMLGEKIDPDRDSLNLVEQK